MYTAGRENGRKTIIKEKVEKVQATKESHSCDVMKRDHLYWGILMKKSTLKRQHIQVCLQRKQSNWNQNSLAQN